jgi:hypothetical protein
VATYVYSNGQDVPLTYTALDDSGTPANAASVTATVTRPDGSTLTPTPANADIGVYQAVVAAPTQAGTYLVHWSATGSGFTHAYDDQFQVRPAGVEQVVDLASVKAHLNMRQDDSTQDTELTGFILAATRVIRDIIGPIVPETHTEFFDGGVQTVSLTWQPLLTIVSVYEYYGLSKFQITEQPLGTQTNAFGFTADYVTGQLTRRTFGGQAALWAFGDKNIQVTSTAGRADVPYNVRLGALELIRHNWSMTQQAGRPRMRSGMDSGGELAVPIGFAVPDRVVEWLAPDRRPPGIA